MGEKAWLSPRVTFWARIGILVPKSDTTAMALGWLESWKTYRALNRFLLLKI